MSIELYNDGKHICLMFSDLSMEGGEAVQANQFLIVDNGRAALIDPGGNIAFNELLLTIGRYVPARELQMILASHADPDIIASLDRWMTSTNATLFISRLWERFAPHFCKAGKTEGRIAGIPDHGTRLKLGNCEIHVLPAHFMHAEGNFQFWDPVSGILFSGDLGVSLIPPNETGQTITSLAPWLPKMEPFHRRYMVSNKILRYWARMARSLPIKMLVPQHGIPLKGAAIGEFIDWIENLDCGIDLMTQQSYQLP
jgi:flavorubredoxin